ncbi:MAG: 3-methyl-2-oxobutanoate hydroxymethyltransferase, partial [Acidobacteria bacterium]|nr:3-methyl-2-oxobutanoate hydroxymethyltransferase [Acidobacteriota bacterium]
SVHRMGGYTVQGRTLESATELLADAQALEDVGVFALVLEGIPRELAAMITRRLRIPTIGIGAGPDCDGQVLVFHDLVGLTFHHPAKFVRGYADLRHTLHEALSRYKDDVLTGRYPGDAESYHCPPALLEQFEKEVSGQPRS